MKLAVLSLSLLAVILLSGCLMPAPSVTPTPEPTPQPTPLLSGCDAKETLFEKDTCFMQKAVNESNSTGCESIVNYSIKDSCYLNFAEKTRNESFCASMREGAGCYLSVAISRGNYSICAGITDVALQRSCRVQLNDSAVICENETGVNFTICAAKVSNLYSRCMSLQGEDQSNCLVSFALNKSQIDACNQLGSSNSKDSCYASLADSTSNSSICELISNANSRDSCLVKFGNSEVTCGMLSTSDLQFSCLASALNMPEYCVHINDTITRSICYEKYAEKFNSSSFCEQIPIQLYKNFCYSNLSLSLGNYLLCAGMSPESSRDQCYARVAESIQSPEACLPIVALDSRAVCQTNIAQLMKDPSQCNAIESNYYKNRCYPQVLNTVAFNVSSCSQISMPTWKDECYTIAAANSENSTICASVVDELQKANCYAGVQ